MGYRIGDRLLVLAAYSGAYIGIHTKKLVENPAAVDTHRVVISNALKPGRSGDSTTIDHIIKKKT